MKLRAHGATDIGLNRGNNEDSFLLNTALNVFVVADGVGGMQGGEIASLAAVDAIEHALNTRRAEALGNIPGLVQEAHRAVLKAGDALPPGGIATTLTLAHIAGGVARIAHVGDSYALLVRKGRCEAITTPHNVGAERRDIVTAAPFPHISPHALTRVLGQLEPLKATIYEEKVFAGDWLILATDGLTDLVEHEAIANLCTGAPDVEDAVAALVNEALAAGGHDNITVVAVYIDAD